MMNYAYFYSKKRKTSTLTDGSFASRRDKFCCKNYAKFLDLHIMSLNNQCTT